MTGFIGDSLFDLFVKALMGRCQETFNRYF